MPNIRDFSNEAGLSPRSEGAVSLSYLANAQRRAGDSFGQDVGNGLEALGGVGLSYLEHRDTTAGAASAAQLLAEATRKWNETAANADPNDPTVGQKFLDDTLAPALEKLKDGSYTEKGRSFLEASAERLTNHFATTTAADMSTLAGIAAKVNLDKTVNQLSNAAASDPSATDTALAALHASVENFAGSPNMDATTRATVKASMAQAGAEAIVKAGVLALTMKNPDAGVAMASSAKYAPYINGAEVKQIEATAKAVLQGNARDARAAKAEERLAARDASDAAIDAYHGTLYNDKGEFRPPADLNQRIMADVASGKVRPEDARPFLSMVENLATHGQSAADSPGLVSKLLDRAATGGLQPADVYQYVGKDNKTGQELTQASANFILGAVKKNAPEDQRALAVFNSAVKSARNLVNPIDKFGNSIFGDVGRADADKMEEAAQLAYFKGLKNNVAPEAMLDPASKDYIFKNEWVIQFKNSGPRARGTSGINFSTKPPADRKPLDTIYGGK